MCICVVLGNPTHAARTHARTYTHLHTHAHARTHIHLHTRHQVIPYSFSMYHLVHVVGLHNNSVHFIAHSTSTGHLRHFAILTA